MKNSIIEKKFIDICNQLQLILSIEKIHDSTNPIKLLYNNIILIKNNNLIITDEDFTYRLELILSDTNKTLLLRIDSLLKNIKTLSFNYFKEEIDIKEYKNNLYINANKILEEKYFKKLIKIDFIYIYYKMTEMLNKNLRNIFSRKLNKITI